MTTAEAAAFLGVDKKTVYTYVRDREKTGFPEPARYVGRTPVWTEEQLRAWRSTHPARRRRKVDTNPGPDETAEN
ncbi:helix-turn-helix domain-containing protein [Micromonospora tulbaghiae]|uniref:helix-turn-helix transcriptional regulator n=1 Tax=Micromonospora tulbaghiae TaxID=479978 RepID=UPI0033BA4254